MLLLLHCLKKTPFLNLSLLFLLFISLGSIWYFLVCLLVARILLLHESYEEVGDLAYFFILCSEPVVGQGLVSIEGASWISCKRMVNAWLYCLILHSICDLVGFGPPIHDWNWRRKTSVWKFPSNRACKNPAVRKLESELEFRTLSELETSYRQTSLGI